MRSAAQASPPRHRARYDVTHVVSEPGDWFISAEIVVPEGFCDASELVVLCCTPGGACTGGYFDLGEPDAGFSFARYAVSAGFACVLVDNLATGRSTPAADSWISPESVARANAEAFQCATRELQAALRGTASVVTIGVGHSMGAMLTLIGQALTGQHAAVACLGFTPAGLPNVLSPHERQVATQGHLSLATLTMLARQKFSAASQPSANQGGVEPFPFNLADTDPAGLQALSAVATNLLPLVGYLALLPGNVADYIREVTVPVFLGGGDHEPWHTAAEVVPAFTASRDVSFYTLIGAAHNHNVAPTRELLWRRLLDWATVIATDHPRTLGGGIEPTRPPMRKQRHEDRTTTQERRVLDQGDRAAQAER